MRIWGNFLNVLSPVCAGRLPPTLDGRYKRVGPRVQEGVTVIVLVVVLVLVLEAGLELEDETSEPVCQWLM